MAKQKTSLAFVARKLKISPRRLKRVLISMAKDLSVKVVKSNRGVASRSNKIWQQ